MIRVLNAGEVSLSEILARTEDKRDIAGTVSAILADVRQNGDAALRRYTKEFDGAEPDALEVPASLLDQALAGLDRDLRAVLEEAAENIRAARFAVILSSAKRTALSWARRSPPSTGPPSISPAAPPLIPPPCS